MYSIYFTSKFERDLKLVKKRGYDISQLEYVIETLELTGKLSPKYLTHKLKGNYSECLECHIKPDWLLIWQQDNETMEIFLIRTGSHSDLF